LRRLYVRGKGNVQKKLLVQAAACNLALLLRKMIGAGTPRALHDVVAGLFLLLCRLLPTARGSIPTHLLVLDSHPAPEAEFWLTRPAQRCRSKMTGSDTGC
jgi:hypothetical protein